MYLEICKIKAIITVIIREMKNENREPYHHWSVFYLFLQYENKDFYYYITL
jgi:hypothetical protein